MWVKLCINSINMLIVPHKISGGYFKYLVLYCCVHKNVSTSLTVFFTLKKNYKL